MVALRAARLISGLVLLAFVLGHLLVVAAGLVSLAAMGRSAGILMAPWATGPGTLVLAAAGLVHIAAGLVSVAVRRSLTLRTGDWIQIALGLAVLPLLIPHVLTVKVAGELAPGLAITFERLLAFYWQSAPAFAIQQLVVVVVVWVHGSIGLYAWMSLQPWWPRVGRVVTPLLFAVPILALLGFVEAGKQVLARLDADAAFAAEIAADWDRLVAVQPMLQSLATVSKASYWLAVGVALAVLAIRMLRHRNVVVAVAYDGGLAGSGRRGLTILEISRLSHVPHASVCSGRGRCGTCRVRVVSGRAALSARDDIERRTLGPGCGPEIRLACRARVLDGGVRVERLLPVDADASAARRPQDWLPAASAPEPVETGA